MRSSCIPYLSSTSLTLGTRLIPEAARHTYRIRQLSGPPIASRAALPGSRRARSKMPISAIVNEIRPKSASLLV